MKKNVLTKVIAVAMILSLVFCFASCGSTKDDKVITYKAITEPTFAPFDTTDKDGNLVGFDMDLMDAIAADQGFKVEYNSMEFDSLIPALQAGEADIITAAMNAEDPARQAKVDFSDTYYDSGLTVVVKENNTTISGIKSLTKDMKVAGQIGTTGAAEATKLADKGTIKKAVILNGCDTMYLQLENGDVDAIIIDAPAVKDYINKQPGKVKMVGDILNAESYGFAVQKGNTELLGKINTGLKNVKENGTYDKLYDKWFN